MSALARWLVALLSCGVVAYSLYAYLVLKPGSTVAPPMREAYAAHPVRILIHVVCSAVALAVGPWQFFPGLRARRRLHRALGYIYGLAVLGGGLAGFATAFIAYGGLVARVGFGLLAVVWLISTAAAIQAARAGDWIRHETWALRSFALTFAAVTLRLYLGSFTAAGLRFEAVYPLVSWLCWVPNLLVVDWFLRRPRP